MKRGLKIVIIIVVCLVILPFSALKLRRLTCIERTKIEMKETIIPEADMLEIAGKLEDRLLDNGALVDRLKDARLLLFGEAHLKEEVIACFLDILNRLPDDRLVLCLELPSSVQGLVDAYLIDGEEGLLDSLGAIRGCLPFQEILRWCFGNQERAASVIAMDETLPQIRFNRRHLCTDTRNQTMKRWIYRAYRDFPDARIIGYGGQMHFLKSGRYKFDVRNRTPAGCRLRNSDIPEEDIRVVMIDGEGGFPLSPAWKGGIGAMEVTGEFARIPFTYFYEYPVFRVRFAEDMFDFFVNVGRTTKIER